MSSNSYLKKKHCYKCGEDYYSFHICSAKEDDQPSLFDNSYLKKKHCYKCGEDYYSFHICSAREEIELPDTSTFAIDKCKYCGAVPSSPGMHHDVTCPNYRRPHRYEDDPLVRMREDIWHRQQEAAGALRVWERI